MRLSAILEPMVAAGVDAKTILATVRAYEDQHQDSIERRRANDRDRQNRRRHVMSRDVTVTERDTPTPDKEKSPKPPKEINPTPTSLRSETKRGTRLPADWALPAGWGRWAVGEGFEEKSIRIEADKFRDFWCSKAGKDATKLDWEATWRNWMRNVPKGRNLGTPPPKPKSDFMQHQDDVQRELDKALGRKRNDEFAGSTLDLDAGNWRAH
ncbi:hypothetical protein GGE68_001416 [Rhizobium leguminosarum]|uniref:hypothetical protein n=1 Tax=Rhizobium leguminosarum TaxID=384 RepID=UPI00160A8319|nr:hypothetical protein [Rhizobium leguminosarum]MBB5663240.1 hypothetical protein [Rhizobium leguminosarum]